MYRNQSEGDHKVQSIKQGEDIALDDLPGTGTGIRFKFVGLATLYFLRTSSWVNPFNSFISIKTSYHFLRKRLGAVGLLTHPVFEKICGEEKDKV